MSAEIYTHSPLFAPIVRGLIDLGGQDPTKIIDLPEFTYESRQARILNTSREVIGICAAIDSQTWGEPYAQEAGLLSLATYLKDLAKCKSVCGLLIGHGNPAILSRFSPTVLIHGVITDQAVENQVSQAGQRMLKVFPSLIPTDVHELHVQPDTVQPAIKEWEATFNKELSASSLVSLPAMRLVRV